MVFPENLGEYLSIDEVSLSQGELYTFITNKNGRGKKGTLVASIKGTLSKEIIFVLEKLPMDERAKVKEVTLDMAKNMECAAKIAFPNCNLVTDRFHVVKLGMEVLQHIRINERKSEMEKENMAIEDAKDKNKKYEPLLLENEDTPKQLLARCRYILPKKEADWTENQKCRAVILFREYPHIKRAYYHLMEFRNIYEQTCPKMAKAMILRWIEKTHALDLKDFFTMANTIRYNLENIIHFFINRSTNANAESFNSKIKLFRANQRGVVDTKFFLFRLKNLFA